MSGRISRRKLLGYGGLAGAAGVMGALPGEPGWLVGPAARVQSTFVGQVFRREDQLSLTVEGVNLKLAKVGEPGPGPVNIARLVRVVIGDPETYLIVHFGPQALAEHAYLETDVANGGGDETSELTSPTAAGLSFGSRLAFKIPPSVSFIPYHLAGLLTWHQYTQSVVQHALQTVTGRPAPTAPGATQTWIEIPRRVVLSPHDGAGWAHSLTVPTTGRVELWHTRLGLRTPTGVDEQNIDDRTVRAVWTPGFVKTQPPDPSIDDPLPLGRNSMTPRDRYEVVRLSSDYTIGDDPRRYLPQPLRVDRLMLSSLGGWLQASGNWPAPVTDPGVTNLVTQSWTHRATMGRDHYVRVVTVGFFLPVRVPAALIEVTERKFQPMQIPIGDPRVGRPTAFLRKRMFLVPARGWLEYRPADPHLPLDGRGLPFKRIRVTTPVTPPLAAAYGANPVLQTGVPKTPNQNPVQPGTLCWRKEAFWPMVPLPNNTNVDFQFAMEAVDIEDRICRLSMPLIFVSATLSDNGNVTPNLVDYYDTYAPASRRTTSMDGQEVALANFGTRGEAAYRISTLTVGAANPEALNTPFDLTTEPRFFPRLAQAEVHLDAVERVRGGSLSPPVHAVRPHDAWLNGTANDAKVFARLVTPVDLTFGANASGGLITPNLKITGLSGTTGPIGGDLTGPGAPPAFTPDFFDNAEPRLLGGLRLSDVLADSAPFTSPGKAPRLISTEVTGGIQSSLTWQPALKKKQDLFEPQPGAAMVISAKSLAKHDGTPPVTEVSGELTNFHLIAVGALKLATVQFRRLRFVSKNGAKPDVDADIAGVRFHGILAFVNALQKFLKSVGVDQSQSQADALSNEDSPAGGSYVEATPNGITIGATVSLPNVPAGAFLLENISLTSELNLPFTDDPARIRFGFASREKPFHLTVAMFGGGGFCGVQFGLDKFELFEVMLEFGAKIALDIAVASGSVSVMGGIYLAIGDGGGELTGFVRINGELDIIEIVSMSVEFYLGLTYTFGDVEEVWGEASVTVEIDVLIFSGSVKLGPVRKRFAGGGGGSSAAELNASARAKTAATGDSPSFPDLMSEVDWQGYCGLFAPAAFA